MCPFGVSLSTVHHAVGINAHALPLKATPGIAMPGVAMPGIALMGGAEKSTKVVSAINSSGYGVLVKQFH